MCIKNLALENLITNKLDKIVYCTRGQPVSERNLLLPADKSLPIHPLSPKIQKSNKKKQDSISKRSPMNVA
jgi:hypothetical protein